MFLLGGEAKVVGGGGMRAPKQMGNVNMPFTQRPAPSGRNVGRGARPTPFTPSGSVVPNLKSKAPTLSKQVANSKKMTKSADRSIPSNFRSQGVPTPF